MRLIDADKFNSFDYDDDRGNEFDSPTEAYIQGVEYVLNEIDKSPTIDVREAKCGKWIPTTNGKFECSVCHSVWNRTFLHDPHCGAKMDAEEE